MRICELYIFIISDIRSVRTIYRDDGGGAAAWAGPDLSINKTQTQNIPRTRDKSDQASGGELWYTLSVLQLSFIKYLCLRRFLKKFGFDTRE